jgi:mannose-6-phosphate isomerase
MEGSYFRVDRVPVEGSRTSDTLPVEGEPTPELAYLFAAAGAAKISGPGFESVEFSKGAMVAVPAAAPEFVVENLGGLELIRITPRWPKEN